MNPATPQARQRIVIPIEGEIQRYYVKSLSENTVFHIVDLGARDGWGECSCIGYQTRKRDCRHIRLARHHQSIEFNQSINRNIAEQSKLAQRKKPCTHELH